jgi:hypothetical protein
VRRKRKVVSGNNQPLAVKAGTKGPDFTHEDLG